MFNIDTPILICLQYWGQQVNRLHTLLDVSSYYFVCILKHNRFYVRLKWRPIIILISKGVFFTVIP